MTNCVLANSVNLRYNAAWTTVTIVDSRQARLTTLYRRKLLNEAIISGDTESYLELISRGRRLEVPSCQQCNSILGAGYDKTLADRKARLKARLNKKLAKDALTPDWTEEELAELSPLLAQWIRQALIRKRIAQERLRW